ncbi:amine oxidase [Lophiostoma macrostomum CBS 122681]|uniref:Amine oxidase n=1 Tax=Lophiostoma macrostomum CBS 122681 TaxID=1314788 RepID=A0A6A6SKJ0_9PLEO|nr:amine oxidase [Lophiostoma macrostomum CBS 122681]
MSRIQKDLSSSPHQQDHLEANGDSHMLRRAVGRIPHVCIIGAGVAGLRCADVLIQAGVKVTVIEGRNRVGGRLCQGTTGGYMVDLGPNWIHGTDSNPILDLARETKTGTINWDGRQAIFNRLGNRITDEDAAENTEIVWNIIEQAMKYSEGSCAEIPADKSLYNYFEDKVKELFPFEIEEDSEAERRRRTILDMAEMWGAFVGSPIQTQSLKFFWLEECIDGENLFVSETYHKVLHRISEAALKGANVSLRKKVTKVISDEDENGPKVTIETDDGSKSTFDEVVATNPLGWLKHNTEAFIPQVPNRLKQAIVAIGYGHLDKVYITFPTAFWNTATNPTDTDTDIQPNSIPYQDSAPNVTATTAPLHQPPSPSINPSHYPGFTHWTAPAYAPESNPSHWTQEGMNLAALPTPHAHPTILFYTQGPTSLHLATQLRAYPSPSHPSAQAMLTTFFLPYYSRLPNYDPANPSHQPTNLLATAWANDELAGYGSYSNFQTGLERGDQDIEVMRRGMPERGVWLAGEHTAPFVALGTVTGAYWSGEGVAKRILKAWELGEVDESKVGMEGAEVGVETRESSRMNGAKI